jgi:hypothetical protein
MRKHYETQAMVDEKEQTRKRLERKNQLTQQLNKQQEERKA